ncbi:MAG: CRTAC1 family protein, partial [Woeseiaceae bacterium]
DIDSDGDLDLFVGAIEGDSNYLFRNDSGTFTDVTANSGIVVAAENSISASFSDYDLDGDLDLFLAHWGNDQQADTETVWDNNGDGTFTSTSIPTGIADQIITVTGSSRFVDYTFAPMMSDIDRDGDPDILFASDFVTSKVFLNNGDATFTDITDRNVIIDRNGMGSAANDYDNDGDMDWFVTSIFEPSQPNNPNPGNRLYRNDGNGVFADVTDAAGVADGGWGWGVCMEDFDNDGDVDIFHVNGWWQNDPRTDVNSYEFASDMIRYFESQGDGTFVETAENAGLNDTGQGRGVACFDSDRDGDLDLVITNNLDDDSVVFYRNELAGSNHYLTVKLNGSGMNTDAIGAMIEITDGTRTQIREIRASNHFVSQNPAEAHFGLGAATSVDMTIFWPGGGQTVMNGVAADQFLTVDQ